MTKLLAVTCSMLALGLVAAGCGSSNDNGGATKTQAKAKAKPTGKTGKTAAVSMKNIQFSPTTVSVAKGTTVEWTNDDSVNHDVTKSGGPGPDFSSGQGNMAKGDTYKQTLNTAGTIKYQCTVHPGMTGTITVK